MLVEFCRSGSFPSRSIVILDLALGDSTFQRTYSRLVGADQDHAKDSDAPIAPSQYHARKLPVLGSERSHGKVGAVMSKLEVW